MVNNNWDDGMRSFEDKEVNEDCNVQPDNREVEHMTPQDAMLLVTFRQEILAEDEIEADKDMLADIESVLRQYSDYQKKLALKNQTHVSVDLIRKHRFKTPTDFEKFLEISILDKLDL